MIKKIYFALENAAEWVDSSTLGLFPTRWYFPDPDVKTVLVDIPGRSGVIDLTETLTGDAAFSNVSGEVAFRVIDSSLFDFSEFRKNYHGLRVKMRTDTDPNYYRVGRVTIIDDDRQDVLRGFTMSMDADPYAYAITVTEQTVPVPVAEDKFLSGTWTGASPKPNTITFTPGVTSWQQNKVRDFDIGVSAIVPTLAGRGMAFSLSLPQIEVEAGAYYMLACDTSWDTSHPEDIFTEATVFAECGGGEYAAGTIFAASAAGAAVVKLRGHVRNYTGISSAGRCTLQVRNLYLYKIGTAAQAAIENNGRMPVIPILTSTVDAVVSINGSLVPVEQGVPLKTFGLELKKGESELIMFQLVGEAAGTATIKFREGDLR